MESSYIIKEFKGADPAFEQYKSLVLATWLRGLKHGCEFFALVDSKCFFNVYPKVILNLLKRPECLIRIAVLKNEEDVAVGWSVSEGKCLHFVYIRPQARKQHIATHIVPKNIEIITHITKVGKSIWKKKLEHVKFNPF